MPLDRASAIAVDGQLGWQMCPTFHAFRSYPEAVFFRQALLRDWRVGVAAIVQRSLTPAERGDAGGVVGEGAFVHRIRVADPPKTRIAVREDRGMAESGARWVVSDGSASMSKSCDG